MKTALRLLLAPPIDADVIGWKSRVIAAGGTVSSGTVLALSRFSKACKAACIWDKLNRVNLFCGNNLTAALVPLKVGAGSATDTNVNFVSGDYTEATGIAGNGTTKHLDTGLLQTAFTAADRHLAVYERVHSTGTFDASMGCEPALNSNQWCLGTEAPATTFSYRSSSGTGGGSEALSPVGFYVGTGSSTTSLLYRAGSQVGTLGVAAATPGAVSMTLFATKRAPATLTAYSNAKLAGYSIGTGLTAPEVAAYNTIMEAFQDALGRGVQ